MSTFIPLAKRPHVLYRFYDWSGELLYIGVTTDFRTRLIAHRNASPWFERVHHMTACPVGSDRVEAHLAESAAILLDQPTYNNHGKTSRHWRDHYRRIQRERAA